MGSAIEEKICSLRYNGLSSTVWHYITDCKRRRKLYYDKSKEGGIRTETLKRENIFALFHPLETVKSNCQEQFEKTYQEYACFRKIHSNIWEFKEMLTGKNADALDKWIKKQKI